jgi:DeoR family glycerol-3-phosphate regulon repressor
MNGSLGRHDQPIVYASRQALEHQAKVRIGRAVAAAIPNGTSLFLNIGTTTEQVARALVEHKGLYVVTNNLTVATILSESAGCQVVVAGGLVRSGDRGIVGEATIELIQQFRVDVGVIGIGGIDADGSLFDSDYRQVRVTQAIIASSRRIYLVADRTKFDRGGMVRLGRVHEVDAVFTDRMPPSSIRDTLATAGVALHIAAEDASRAA